VGLRLKKIAFIYLISYLSVTAVGFGLFPALTLKLFLSNGDYGVIMPRVLGAMMGVLSFLLFVVYRNGDWKTYSPFTMMARTPLVPFVFHLYYLSRQRCDERQCVHFSRAQSEEIAGHGAGLNPGPDIYAWEKPDITA